MSEKELGEFKEYLDINLKKRFIKLLISLVEYLIIFVLKINGKLWLYVDYWQLNKIIIKNRYSLFLIFELCDRIRGTKIFIILDF